MWGPRGGRCERVNSVWPGPGPPQPPTGVWFFPALAGPAPVWAASSPDLRRPPSGAATGVGRGHVRRGCGSHPDTRPLPPRKTPRTFASSGRAGVGTRATPRCWAPQSRCGPPGLLTPPGSRVGEARWAGPAAAGAAPLAQRSLEGARTFSTKAPPPCRGPAGAPSPGRRARLLRRQEAKERSAGGRAAGETPGTGGLWASSSQWVGAGRVKGEDPSRPLRLGAPRRVRGEPALRVHLHAPGTLRSRRAARGRVRGLGRADNLGLSPGRAAAPPLRRSPAPSGWGA